MISPVSLRSPAGQRLAGIPGRTRTGQPADRSADLRKGLNAEVAAHCVTAGCRLVNGRSAVRSRSPAPNRELITRRYCPCWLRAEGRA
jgi:hypothetical protein